jgi:hypothetical protein
MWPVIRSVLLRPQTIVVLALLFLMTDALLSIFSPVNAAADPDRIATQDCRVIALAPKASAPN